MKKLSNFINENLVEGIITEAKAKDVKIPRKGSTIYILKDGETKAHPVVVSDVQKIKNSWYGRSGGYDVYIKLAENEYGYDGWKTMHYADPRMDEPIQIDVKRGLDGTFYIGTSKEVIAEFIKNDSTKKLKHLLNQIKDVEDQLFELNKQKDILQGKIDAEITENLNQE